MAVSLGLHRWWGDASGSNHLRVTFGLFLMALTAAALGLARAWDSSIPGQGSEEFSRLLRAFVAVAVMAGAGRCGVEVARCAAVCIRCHPVAFVLADSVAWPCARCCTGVAATAPACTRSGRWAPRTRWPISPRTLGGPPTMGGRSRPPAHPQVPAPTAVAAS